MSVVNFSLVVLVDLVFTFEIIFHLNVHCEYFLRKSARVGVKGFSRWLVEWNQHAIDNKIDSSV